MIDFAAARRLMVEGQIRTFDVNDQNVLAAMLDVPRERFVPESRLALAYLDNDVPLEGADRRSKRRLLKPMVLARLLQIASITSEDRVLDVGCGTGYSSAVLGKLAREVVALEEDSVLAGQARVALAAGSAANVTIAQGPLTEGWPSLSPYDVILLNGTAEIIPDRLLSQLRDGGRLVGIVGAGPATKAMLYLAVHGEASGRAIFDAAAAPLPGFTRPLSFVF
jgi:protein-L-isoaspartate(D-aspartate) O-methyltransferase